MWRFFSLNIKFIRWSGWKRSRSQSNISDFNRKLGVLSFLEIMISDIKLDVVMHLQIYLEIVVDAMLCSQQQQHNNSTTATTQQQHNSNTTTAQQQHNNKNNNNNITTAQQLTQHGEIKSDMSAFVNFWNVSIARRTTIWMWRFTVFCWIFQFFVFK